MLTSAPRAPAHQPWLPVALPQHLRSTAPRGRTQLQGALALSYNQCQAGPRRAKLAAPAMVPAGAPMSTLGFGGCAVGTQCL